MYARQKLWSSHAVGLCVLCCAILAAIIFMPGLSKAAETSGRMLKFQVLPDLPPDTEIEDVCCNGRYTFHVPPVTSFLTGYGGSTHWLKLDVPDNTGLIQLSPILDDVTLFVKSGEGTSWKTVRAGDMIAKAQKALISPFMALPLPDDLADRTVYIRVIQTTAVTVKARFWSLPDFFAMQSADRTFKTYLLGFVSAMILYNVFVSLLVRDMGFLLNALTIASLLMLALYLSGYGAVFFWTGWTGWSNYIQIAAIFLTIVCGSLFLWVFVNSKEDRVTSASPLVIAPALALTAAVSAFVLPYWVIQLWMLANGICFFLMAGWYIVAGSLRGDLKARIILVPLLFVLIPGMVMVAIKTIFGFEPAYFKNNVLEVTLCLEAALFSLALASKIRITELATRKANARLMAVRKESLAKIIAAQDSERQRLAKELHDGVGQDFLVVVGSLKRLARESMSANLNSVIPDLIASATSALDELRRISKDMYPPSIKHLGLANAIGLLLEHLETSQQIETDLELDIDETVLPPEAKLHVYRIIQECLSNIARHSSASQCKISMLENDSDIVLDIEDDGIGMEDAGTAELRSSGLGLTSIAERVLALNGTWQMSKSQLGGLRSHIRFPAPDRYSTGPSP